MSDSHNVYPLSCIVDEVEHPIVADADTVGILALELLDAGRTWIGLERPQCAFETLKDLAVQRIQFLFGRALQDNVVAHGWGRRMRSLR